MVSDLEAVPELRGMATSLSCSLLQGVKQMSSSSACDKVHVCYEHPAYMAKS